MRGIALESGASMRKRGQYGGEARTRFDDMDKPRQQAIL
jgi:hypothetical protein